MALSRLSFSSDEAPEILPLFVASVGYIIALIVAIILLSQLVYAYNNTFASTEDTSPKRSKVPYILVIIYLTLTTIAIILWLSLETNILTGFDQKFTNQRCIAAFILWPSLTVISYAILSLIFLHRIYMTFKDSAFEYKPWIYRTFLFVIVVNVPLLLSVVYGLLINSAETVAFYDSSTNLTLCGLRVVTDSSFQIGSIIMVGFLLLSQAITSAGLLILFVRGLWRLNKQMMVHFMKQQNRSNAQIANPVEMVKSNSTGDDEQPEATVNNIMNTTIARNPKRPELETIVELHNLMKKQTILVCVSIVSSMTLGIMIIINFDLLAEQGWDIIVNEICVWMMLNTSKRYWNLCRRYGFCVCCYWKTNKMGM